MRTNIILLICILSLTAFTSKKVQAASESKIRSESSTEEHGELLETLETVQYLRAIDFNHISDKLSDTLFHVIVSFSNSPKVLSVTWADIKHQLKKQLKDEKVRKFVKKIFKIVNTNKDGHLNMLEFRDLYKNIVIKVAYLHEWIFEEQVKQAGAKLAK